MADSTIDRMNIYRTATSFSHILGNLTAIMENYIKAQFPNDYFKTTYVTTEAGFRTIRDFKNKQYTFDRPHLTIDPKFLSDQESDALPQINWGKFNTIDTSNNPSLIMMNNEFFMNSDTPEFSLGYYFNRYKFSFGISMIVDTQMMRMSLVNYLRNMFRFKQYYPITRYIETMIPKPYINQLAIKLGLDIQSEEFLSTLNTCSQYPILRMFRPATGLTEFFVCTQGDIQLRIPDYPAEDTIKVARIESYSQVRFEFEAELNLMSSFLLAIPEDIIIEDNELTNKYTARFAIAGRVPIPDRILNNQLMYTRILFEADTVEETIDMTKWVSDELNKVREYVVDKNITASYITVKAYSFLDEIDLTNPDNGSIDYSTLQLNLKLLQKETVYTVIIYYDMDFIKTITKFMNDETLVHTPDEYIKK